MLFLLNLRARKRILEMTETVRDRGSHDVSVYVYTYMNVGAFGSPKRA